MIRQCGRAKPVFFETHANRVRLTTADAITFRDAPLSQIRVQFVDVFHLRYRCGPVTLQSLHTIFHNRFFVAASRHAVQRVEREVTLQRCVSFVDRAFTTFQNRRRHRFRIVPPDFLRHTSKEFKSLRHPFQYRFGPLSRQSNRKRSIRIRPHQNQHVDFPSAVRKVDGNFTEVGFHALTGRMVQRNECLSFRLAMLLHETSNRVVLTDITFLVALSFKHPHRRVTLLRRSLFMQLQNLQNSIMKQSRLRSRLTSPSRVLPRLGLIVVEDFSNCVPRMMKPLSHLANAHAVTMSSPNPSVIVHREHP